MERVRLQPSGPLTGEVSVPADKSITHRAIILGALAEGRSRIFNPLRGEDCLRTLHAFRALGVEVEDRGNELIFQGRGLAGLREPGDVIDCGNSGTTARLLCGVLSAQFFFSVLTGDASLRRRPMERVTDPLSKMGGRFAGRDGGSKLPLAILGGPVRSMRYDSPVASAQVKTAILLAGLFCEGRTEVSEPERSRDHTERMLKAFGADLCVEGRTVGLAGRPRLAAQEFTVPADLSSAAFFVVAALLVPGSEVMIPAVGINPTRTGVLEILKNMGADLTIEDAGTVSGEPVANLRARFSPLRGTTIDGELVVRAIDEFPALCVAAAFAEGRTRISGAAELRVKESDRIAVMADLLRRMGAPVDEYDDGMEIEGGQTLRGIQLDARGDHRIAMAMAVAALRAAGGTEIRGAACVGTSFPGFFDSLRTLGAEVAG